MNDTLDPLDWAESLPARFVVCRDLGHRWKTESARYAEKARTFERALRCTRCSTVRIQSLNGRGYIEESRYVYPDGYARPHGSGYFDIDARATLRLVSIERDVERTADE